MNFLSKIKYRYSLQIAFYIAIITLIIFSLMYTVNTVFVQKIMIKNAEQLAKSMTWEVINKINGTLTKIEKINSNINYLVHNLHIEQKEQSKYIKKQIYEDSEIYSVCVAYTHEYLRRHPYLSSFVLKTKDSLFVEEDISKYASEYELDDWFIIPQVKRKRYWSEPWIDKNVGNETITSFSEPIYENNEVIGIVRTDISLQVLQRTVSSIRIAKVGYAVLLSSNGTFITHPADSLILHYTIFNYTEQVQSTTLNEVGRNMVKGETGFVNIPYSDKYISSWMFYAPISHNNWSVAIKFNENEIMGDQKRVNLIFTIILVLGFIILLLSFQTRITTIFKPLRLLSEAALKIGRGDFQTKIPETKTKNEVSLLTEAFSKMQSELITYTDNLIKTNREKDKITAEIKFAAQIQQNIVPSNQNLIPEIKEVSVYGILESAEEIGGDMYDVFPIDDKRICFAIADVFGKGIVAAMMMTMVHTLIRSKAKLITSVKTLTREINTYLYENNKQSNFITIIVGILDISTGLLEFCNSGHTPIYLRKENQQCIRYGETHTTALGIFPELDITSTVIQLSVEDCLIMFTDGITEAMSENEIFFGYERLESIVCQLQNPTPESIIKAILKGVRSFTGHDKQSDDLSILVIKLNHPKLL